jgi:hypothetical protein
MAADVLVQIVCLTHLDLGIEPVEDDIASFLGRQLLIKLNLNPLRTRKCFGEQSFYNLTLRAVSA